MYKFIKIGICERLFPIGQNIFFYIVCLDLMLVISIILGTVTPDLLASFFVFLILVPSCLPNLILFFLAALISVLHPLRIRLRLYLASDASICMVNLPKNCVLKGNNFDATHFPHRIGKPAQAVNDNSIIGTKVIQESGQAFMLEFLSRDFISEDLDVTSIVQYIYLIRKLLLSRTYPCLFYFISHSQNYI